MFAKLLVAACLATAFFALAAPASATGVQVCVANGGIIDCAPVGDLTTCLVASGNFSTSGPAAVALTWCV